LQILAGQDPTTRAFGITLKEKNLDNSISNQNSKQINNEPIFASAKDDSKDVETIILTEVFS